ncbi:hypothetical protein HPB47_012999 [Ixodes persulcatus]|uniref:Uncharacterized protein n=1 Tax=Ixodes persulcatus TaxID=34615 RepID=A0AC60NS01_IXOPE|nr:hypothetical protein HPB47_012999 [Ixodes persulcatus]
MAISDSLYYIWPYIKYIRAIFDIFIWVTKRWRNERLNKKLKTRIQVISRKEQEYPAELTRQNWCNLCDCIQGRLSSASSWKLLKALLDWSPTTP